MTTGTFETGSLVAHNRPGIGLCCTTTCIGCVGALAATVTPQIQLPTHILNPSGKNRIPVTAAVTFSPIWQTAVTYRPATSEPIPGKNTFSSTAAVFCRNDRSRAALGPRSTAGRLRGRVVPLSSAGSDKGHPAGYRTAELSDSPRASFMPPAITSLPATSDDRITPSAHTSTLAAECRPSSRRGIDCRHHAAAGDSPV